MSVRFLILTENKGYLYLQATGGLLKPMFTRHDLSSFLQGGN
jgi:hypothetical protein